MYAVFVECANCHNISMHLVKTSNKIFKGVNFYILVNSGKELCTYTNAYYNYTYKDLINTFITSNNETFPVCVDENIIMSIPTSFFTIDERIPRKFRELIEEAEKCIQNNCLTGASACIRKTIYEFLMKENAVGSNYEEKIKSLKGRHITLENDYIDMLSGIQGIMCDQVHENTVYENFTSQQAKGYIEILKEIFNHFYVLPEETKTRKSKIDALVGQINKQK